MLTCWIMVYIRQHFDRRDFLRLLGSAAVFASAPRALQAVPDDYVTVSILHTTDLHGHILPTVNYEGIADLGGIARCATQIAFWRRQNPNSLLVDAGDVIQGTHASLSTQGRIIIDAFNHMGYDAWVLGNHEFDWGIKPVHEVLQRSGMPVLTANCSLDGQRPGEYRDGKHPFARIQPYLLKEVAGFRIGIIGITTPGMPYWFHESFFKGFEFLDPVQPVRQALKELRARKADAVMLVGHMGLRRGGDDFANRVESLTAEFPEIAGFIGGHTHQNEPNVPVNNVSFSQASYHGIHAGRFDLVFDRQSRRLLWTQPMTALMDRRISMDPAILSMAEKDLENSARVLAQPVGTLDETLGIQSEPGKPSDVEQLIAAAIMEGLQKREVEVDGVIHGLLFPDGDLPAGRKTVADLWKVIPYENQIITARLNRDEIRVILLEIFGDFVKRSLMGMQAIVAGRGRSIEIVDILDRDGQPLQSRKRYTIALNTFDAQSGGKRYLTLRDIVRQPTSAMRIHPVQTREMLIDYFSAREVVLPVWRQSAQTPEPAVAI